MKINLTRLLWVHRDYSKIPMESTADVGRFMLEPTGCADNSTTYAFELEPEEFD